MFVLKPLTWYIRSSPANSRSTPSTNASSIRSNVDLRPVRKLNIAPVKLVCRQVLQVCQELESRQAFTSWKLEAFSGYYQGIVQDLQRDWCPIFRPQKAQKKSTHVNVLQQLKRTQALLNVVVTLDLSGCMDSLSETSNALQEHFPSLQNIIIRGSAGMFLGHREPPVCELGMIEVFSLAQDVCLQSLHTWLFSVCRTPCRRVVRAFILWTLRHRHDDGFHVLVSDDSAWSATELSKLSVRIVHPFPSFDPKMDWVSSRLRPAEGVGSAVYRWPARTSVV